MTGRLEKIMNEVKLQTIMDSRYRLKNSRTVL
jgi:hypothetical protein